MHCAKYDFPHAQYAFYLHAIDTRRAVNCGIAAVTWCDVTANHRCAAHSIPHFTFRIPHAAVPHFTHSPVFRLTRETVLICLLLTDHNRMFDSRARSAVTHDKISQHYGKS